MAANNVSYVECWHLRHHITNSTPDLTFPQQTSNFNYIHPSHEIQEHGETAASPLSY